MNRATCLAVALFVAVVSFHSLRAQQPEGAGETPGSLLSELKGTWRPIQVNINGQPGKELLYGPSVFEGNSWIMQTTNGDHVYELSAVNEKAVPAEITFVDEAAKNSFVGLVSLEHDTLTIARGTAWTRDEAGNHHIPRPESLAPGRNTIVYTWKRVADPAGLAERPTLTIRMFDDSKPERVLAEHTIQAFFGGKLEYVTGGEAAPEIRSRSQAFGRRVDNPITIGTRITGSLEGAGNGRTRVSVEIQLGNAVSTDEPETEIVRTESLVLQTILKSKEKKRIHCGGNRWCELVLD